MSAVPLALERADEALSRFVDHPSGYLCLSDRNERFTSPRADGFVAYRHQGKHLICLGGVHAPESSRSALLDELLAMAESRRRKLVFVQVPADQTELFRSRGFVVNSMGATFALHLPSFSLGGSHKMKLRNKIKRARKLGVEIVEVDRDLPRNADVFEDLRAVSEAWLEGKHKKELDFMIGELGGPEDADRRIFAARDNSGATCAFITYVAAYGSRPGFLHDLTRKAPDAPTGVMELMNLTAIERFAAEGVKYLHLGFTPFVSCGGDGPEDSPGVAWFIRMLERHGAAVYPSQTQSHYKRKWGPQIIEPEYVAFRPLSLRAIFDLLVLTRSI